MYTSSAIVIKGAFSRACSFTLSTFWIETVQSTGTLKITWDAFWEISETGEEDRKMLFIMNPDGSRNIEADIYLGFKVPLFHWLPIVFIPSGLALCLIAVFLIKQKKLIKRQQTKMSAVKS
ncbi:MAG: hypothetical protein CW716_10035 [Candidatus Bathyarchaeum sp.]|nr:MAG: hypothetical protein CW716_10035 [Candidatus Bathyarchaeum sp.]